MLHAEARASLQPRLPVSRIELVEHYCHGPGDPYLTDVPGPII